MSVREEVASQLTLIGGRTEEFRKYLATRDPCFGRRYNEKAQECKDCVCPVIHGGKVTLLKSICAEVTQADRTGSKTAESVTGATPLRMSARQCMERLQAGKSTEEIFREILNGADADVHGRTARQILYDAYFYVRQRHGLPTPKIPTLAELKERL